MKVVLLRIDGGLTEPEKPQTLGELIVYEGLKRVFECKILEKPWRDNKRGESCIYDGTYKVRKWTAAAAKKAGKKVDYDHFEILSVLNRQGILIHVGNYENQIHGCQLPGTSFVDINGDGRLDVVNSKATLAKMFELLPDEFEYTIKSV